MKGLTILGGGAAGLGLGFYARRAGVPFVLFEGTSALGGMCRTLSRGAHRFDIGAHRFHDSDAEVTRDVRSLLGAELRPVRAPSQIWTRGRRVDFPPTPLNAVGAYGLRGAARIGVELLKARCRPRSAKTFEDFAHNSFGPTLGRNLLLNYSEKLWGLPAAQLSPDIATRRLGGMTLRSLLTELMAPGSKAAHIDGQFLYPRSGFGEISRRLAAALPPDSIKLGRRIVRLETSGRSVSRIHFADGGSASVEGRVVSTLPVTLLVKLLGEAIPADAREAAARLRFRRLRLVFVRLDQPCVSKNASIYLPEPDFLVSRVCEPKNRSAEMSPKDETALVAEIPFFPGDAVDVLSEAEIVERAIADLCRVGLIRREKVLVAESFRVPFAYPVCSIGCKMDLDRVQAGLSEIANLDSIGRAGAFRYSHLHDQLRFGKDYVSLFSRGDRRSAPPLSDEKRKERVRQSF